MPTPFLDLLFEQRLVAIVRLDDLTHAIELSRALLAGGIAIQEFTLTNPESLTAIERIRENVVEFRNGSAYLGLGSVRSLAVARQAIDAGAQFIVTPIVRLDTIEFCRQKDIPIMPGAFTPTEISQAWDAGASLVKVFPARQLGPQYVKDVLAPMPYLKLMPTGGIDLKNMTDYFDHGASAVGVGGQLVDPQQIQRQDWNAVTEIARRYAEMAKRIHAK